jgi:hypothetical protein
MHRFRLIMNRGFSLVLQCKLMSCLRRPGLLGICGVLVVLQSACNPIGGGGDGSSGGNEPPVVDAGSDQAVTETASVTLTGTASDPDGSIATVEWVQSAGPSVTLNGADSLASSFIAPSISAPSTLIFRLTARDSSGARATDTTTVLVNPDPALNSDPIADAGPDETVAESTTVRLDGGASSDSDGSVQAYAWTQVANGAPGVGLSDSTSVVASFIAPDVSTPADLVFELIVTDDEGAQSVADRITITVIEATGVVQITGRITFDMVPVADTGGLDYSDTQQLPAREVLVEAVNSSNQAVLATVATDVNGNFSLSVQAQVEIFIRARAQMRDLGSESAWDFRVVDNDGTLDFGASKPLYVLDSDIFNSGVTGVSVDLHAESGWDSAVKSYLNARAAAPFAILDVVYDAWQLALDADPSLKLPALTVNWSPNNSLAINSIQGSLFANGEMFLMGKQEQDTDEYDRHVIAHEWGHYFEDAVSRTDSIGGPHLLTDKMDARVALSEGWSNAFSAMVTGDENYKDSCCLGQSSAAIVFSLEDNCVLQGNAVGWYSECSAGSLLYDFFDPPPGEVTDTVNLGFQPIYEVLTGELATTPALTTLFAFTEFLQNVSPADASAIGLLVQNQNIQIFGQDEYGSAEIDNGGNADVLPVYRDDLIVGGPAINVCTNDVIGEVNKLGNRQYVRFEIIGNGEYSIRAETTDSVSGSDPDPELRLFLSGFLSESLKLPAVDETLEMSLDVGEYVLEVWDDNNVSASQIGSLDPGRYCVDLTVSPI